MKRSVWEQRPLTDYERGVVIGLLIGEASFTGDGRAPQLVVRMHVRHARILRWLHGLFPRTKLYGPYFHGGRHYLQWMARGPSLREDVLPQLAGLAELDPHVEARMQRMVDDYSLRAPEPKRLA